MADSEGLFAASMASSAVHIQENNKLREMETRIADLSRKAARERSNLERRHDDDAAVSAGVVVSGLVIWMTGTAWIDPAVSLVIAALIFWQTWGLLRETVEMSLAAVPRAIDYDRVWDSLAALPGVAQVHDLHIWPMSTTEPVLTAHLLMPSGHPGDSFLRQAQDMLHDRFGIGHATLQVETGEAPCVLEPDEAV